MLHPARALLEENESLRHRVTELETVLDALAQGSADALVVAGQGGERILLREGSELPYLAILEAMNEGALTLSTTGDILYCNPCFAGFVGLPIEQIRGRALQEFVSDEHTSRVRLFLETGQSAPCRVTLNLRPADGATIPVQISVQPLVAGPLHAICAVVSDMRAAAAAAKALQQSEHRWRELSEQWSSTFDAVTDPIFLHDAELRLVRANRAYFRVAGIEPEAALGRPYWEVFPRGTGSEARFEHLLTGATGVELGEEILQGERCYRSRSYPVHDGEDRLLFGIHVLEDVTARRESENQQRLAASVFANAGEGIVVTDAQSVILAVNDAFSRITGFEAAQVLGQKPSILKSGRHTPVFYREMWRSLLRQGWWQGEVWNRRREGELFPEWLTITEVRNSSGKVSNYVGIFSDITAIKNSQVRIEFLATHDELTGLPNRNLFLDRVSHAIERAERDVRRFALFFIDLDNFKVVNDSLGHQVGDLLLKETAVRLREAIRSADTVARFGGDEFALIVEDADGDEAILAAQRLVANLAKPFFLSGQQVHVGASIGISLFPSDGKDADTLLKCADNAMYEAKSQGKGRHKFFSPQLRAAAEERLKLETGLYGAIAGGELFLCYQPQVDLASGTLVGLEALIRWRHPELGLVSPSKFIPVAEKSRLIDDIGTWVADVACRQIARWIAAGYAVPRVSVNVSAQQFGRQDVPKIFAGLLARHGLEGSRLMVELTESALVENPDEAKRILDALKKIGIQLSIDDFGTGYSSLSYLRRFPLDELKIDRCFIERVDQDPGDKAIARTIIAMAEILGLSVMAEGIENTRQAETLLSLGCKKAQGFYFAQPLTVADVEQKWLRCAASCRKSR